MTNNFFNIILLASSTFTMHTVYSVCHLRFFCYWLDGRDQNKNDFWKLGTDLEAKSIYWQNQESAQNVGTKSALLPISFLSLHFFTSPTKQHKRKQKIFSILSLFHPLPHFLPSHFFILPTKQILRPQIPTISPSCLC